MKQNAYSYECISTSFTEANYENAVIEILSNTLVCGYVYGPDVARDYADNDCLTGGYNA
jgi:hypothetical protein